MKKLTRYLSPVACFFRYLRYRPPSGTLAPTVVPLANGGQANIAVSNTDPNLFTYPATGSPPLTVWMAG
jgi:hypothetical protein